MTLEFIVSEQTVVPVPSCSIPRRGSQKYLNVKFLFNSDWAKYTTRTVYFQAEGYSDAVILEESNEVAVGNFFAAQESFQISLTGMLDDEAVPTNTLTISLDPSGDVWLVNPPEVDPTAYQQILQYSNASATAAEAAQAAAKKSAAAAEAARESAKKVESLKDGSGNINVQEAKVNDTMNLGDEENGVYIYALGREDGIPVVDIGGRIDDAFPIVRGVADPVYGMDAVNKGYLDARISMYDGYLCTNGAYVGGDTWSMAEPAAVMDVPYLKEYGYKCAAEDGTQELYTWIYRCLYEGFSVPYRTVSVNGVETVFETEAAKDDAVIVDHIEANYGQYAATILKMLESEDIGLLRIPLVQFPELTQQSVRHAFERVTQDSPEMCFPFFPLSAANEVFMPVIALEDGYSFLYSFFPTAQKREEINATIAAAVEAVKAKVYEVHGVKAGDALTEDQKRKVAKTIHDWIIINSNYNGEIVTYWQPTMYGVFNPAISASCEGYTQAFNYLVRLYGIEAVTLTGIAYYGWDGESYNISGGHAWNAVNLTDEYGAYSADASKWAALDVYWDVPSHEVKVSGELPEGNVIWKYFMNPANVLAAYGSESYREITTDGSYGAYPFGNAPSADYSYNGNSEYIWED